MGTWNCTRALIHSITAQGHGNGHQFGHNFVFDFHLQYRPTPLGRFRDPGLEWFEEIVTFAPGAGGRWQETDHQAPTNMYDENPNSNTFFLWRRRYITATYPEGEARIANVPLRATEDQRRAATIHHLKRHTTTIRCSILDTPMLGKSAKNVPRTVRRIIFFDLGIRDGGERATATQILEIDNGVIRIMKFITPGLERGTITLTDPRLPQWRDDYERQRGEHPRLIR